MITVWGHLIYLFTYFKFMDRHVKWVLASLVSLFPFSPTSSSSCSQVKTCTHPRCVRVCMQSTVRWAAQCTNGAQSVAVVAANFRDYISSTKMTTLLNSLSMFLSTPSLLLLPCTSPPPPLTDPSKHCCFFFCYFRLSNLHLPIWWGLDSIIFDIFRWVYARTI